MVQLIRYLPVAIFIALGLTSCTDQPCTADLAILGGNIVDGTGKAAFRGDIYVRGNVIHQIDRGRTHHCLAGDTIDATGLIVAPGFIDVHAHGDPMQTPEFENFLAMGVTTIFLGQDGSSPWIADLNHWISTDSLRTGVNIGYLAGHATLRRGSGVGHTAANDREIERMTELVEDAFGVGCFGISTGLEYIPGSFASQQELIGLAQAVAKYDGMIMSHLRSEDDEVLEKSLHELIRQGEYCRVHAAHLKSVYGRGAERAEEILSIIEEARQAGIVITADMYPYLASYTGISIVFPPWAKTTEDFEYAKVSRRAELERYLYDRVMARNGPGATLFGGPPFIGQTLEEVAKESGRPFVDILMSLGPESLSAAYFIMDEDLQERLFLAPYVMVGSDGSPTMHHPRGHGTFARVLRQYVLENQKMSLEEAVHKMTGMPANTTGLDRRGTIAEGKIADLIVFDTSRVRDVATFADPHRFAEGFDHIIVNGSLARSIRFDSIALHGHILNAHEE